MIDNQAHKYFHRRRSGILLHPSSLPSAGTDGALGDEGVRFLDFLAEAGFSIWQMLPVNSTDEYGSPYQGTSVHAGNSRLICLQQLISSNWLEEASTKESISNRVPIIELIARARRGFERNATASERSDFMNFKESHSTWLDDYALFSVISQNHDHSPWWEWPEELCAREQAAMDLYRNNHLDGIEDYYFEQYIFYSQWKQLRSRATDKGILLFGDMPIFVAHNSVDVWARPECFQLDNKGQPTSVAGVPPDYFSPTGQRWGNPLYRWPCMVEDGYQWWVNRLRTQFELFDLVRLDHFRGFVSLWEIPATCQTAVDGKWEPVPGLGLFETLVKEFGTLPLVAEDLGTISEEVTHLREKFNLPGMKVLLFAFDSDENNPYLPHNHELNSIIYTGTHDNNTTLGWFYNLDDEQQYRVLDYLGHPGIPMPWPMIHTALRSNCQVSILPMQDILGLDGSHRMNTPGTIEGNWSWRFDWEWVSPDLIEKLNHLNSLYGRS